MADFDLQKILELWILATGEEHKDFNKVRLGVESDWLCHKAKNLMKTDPSGVLSAFAMRAAYVKYINEHHIDIKDLINGEWDKIRAYWEDLYKQLYVENAGYIINHTETKLLDILKKLGHEITVNELRENDFETVFVDAFEEFGRYSKDIFSNPSQFSELPNGSIVTKLFYFEHYKQFVDALRNSSEDNLIVVAFIDRVNDTIESEFDEHYDKFFAFGIKRDGGIAVVSDRTHYSSPEFNLKTRNPSRELEHKISYSHLPYHNYEKIISKNEVSTQLLLPSPSTTEHNELCEEIDTEGYIYIATLLSIIYERFFKSTEFWGKPAVLFSSECKFLTAAESKALVVKDENIILIPDSDVTAKGYNGSDRIANHGIYDFYISRFPIKEMIPFKFNGVATKEEMKDNAWWMVRKAQEKAVEDGLRDSYSRKQQLEITEWVTPLIYNNIKDILEYTFTHDDCGAFDNYSCSSYHNDNNRPILYEEWGAGNELNTVQIKSRVYKSHSYWFDKPRWWDRSYKRCDDMVCMLNHSIVDVYWETDNDNRSTDVEFIMRSYSDLVKFLKLESKDKLPIELQSWLYPRVDHWGIVSWRPERGNSILHFTDPMNDIRDPWHEFPIYVRFHLSKTKYKELVKLYGNKRTSKPTQKDED